ncbi:hypothetical protein Clacol_005792 [Clathrus columnatus]|uniref:Uncharacterized protein n=1 Tax=Clathrus columnatus TaxID=1419009 RepID=A0AAV5AEK9_9AGAM|nr:hypothetical protein Clacol_005792 [Clathrus columnatus]
MASLEERKELLFNDPDLSVVEPHRVFCKRCDKWLKLDEVKLYAASVWRCHKNTKSHNARPPASDGPSPAPALAQESGGKNGRRGVRSSTKGSSSARQSLRSGTSTPVASPADHTVRSQVQTRLTIKIPSNLQTENYQETHSTSPVNRFGSVPKSSSHFSKPSKHSLEDSRSRTLQEYSPGALSEDSSIEATLIPSPSNHIKEPEGHSTSESAFPYPDNLSPNRKASYKALRTEPFVGRLEPFRAYCTLCARWVPLSSRTPYSHGVWKGHVKNSEKHNATTQSNFQDENFESHSPERTGFRKMFGFPKSNRLAGLNTVQPSPYVHGEGTSKSHNSSKDDGTDVMEVDSVSNNKKSNPFALKAATDSSFGPRRGSANLNESRNGVVEGDIPALTDSSDGEPFAKQTPQKKASLIALERRRQTIILDSDAAVVEPRRVKCGICERWIKGSNTQEYSLHHWLKHKKKCLRNKKALLADKSELIETRKSLLEADPDLTAVEAHRVLCNICKKASNHYSIACAAEKQPFLKAECFKANDVVRKKLEKAPEIRQETLKADCLITNLSPHRFDCRVCHTGVELDQSPPFTLRDDLTPNGNESKSNPIEATTEPISAPTDDTEEVKLASVIEPDPKSLPNAASSNDQTNKIEEEDIKMVDEDRVILPFQNEENLDDVVKVVPEPDNLAYANTRLNYFLAQHDVFKIEPHRAFCGNCLTWITLGSDAFNVQKWEAHKTACRGPKSYKTPDDPQATDVYGLNSLKQALASRPSAKSIGPSPKKRIKSVEGKRPRSPAALLPPLPPRPRWPTEDERKQLFLDDPDVLKVEPHRLLCKSCNCWIRLHPVVRYSQSVWPKHKIACRETSLEISPGDARVRAKNEKENVRRQMLEDDPHVTDITPHRVTCKACGTNIRLDTTYKYEGSHWRAHRARCAHIPFHERTTKKRKQEGRRASQTHDSGRLQEHSPTGESSDSYDSDASSAPRPQPTSFFTTPLEINPMKMFSSRIRHHYRNNASTDPSKEKPAYDLSHLHKIAKDLTESGRLDEIINKAGNGTTSSFPESDSTDEEVPSPDIVYPVCRPEYSEPEVKPPVSPYLDVPRIKDPETADMFDELFRSSAYASQHSPDHHTRMCTLNKDSLPILE